MSRLALDLQRASTAAELPTATDFEHWVKAALRNRTAPAELTIRIVDTAEGQQLNETWRHKTGPTNVLSFPFDNPPGLTLPLLGDIVICAPVVVAEAAAQGKPLTAHWAHLVIHGVLHLLGMDHQTEAEADAMERLEIEILHTLGYPNPYATTEQ
jgi:probable rRNA maturation factor